MRERTGLLGFLRASAHLQTFPRENQAGQDRATLGDQRWVLESVPGGWLSLVTVTLGHIQPLMIGEQQRLRKGGRGTEAHSSPFRLP